MGHDHTHHANRKALLITFILITSFMIAEFIGGLITNSLALLSDAGHMLSDSFSLALSLFALIMSNKAANERKTYGFKRFEILAALFNGITLFAISLYIFWEALQRFSDPPTVASFGMLGIAALGILVNIIVAWILKSKGDTENNLYMGSAFLHVIGDMLGSIGAIIAALLIFFFNWEIADPNVSILVSILIIISGWRLTRDSFHILMEGVPEDVDIKNIKGKLLSIPGVTDIHDLHIWTITSGFQALSGHLDVRKSADRDAILQKATTMLKEEFAIEHLTLQLEGEDVSLKKEEHHWHWD